MNDNVIPVPERKLEPMPQLAISVPEMAQQLGISRRKAYELVKRRDFPAFRLDGRILVMQSSLAEWFEAQLLKQKGDVPQLSNNPKGGV